ncbi:DUF4147 domain-containing protein [uncultured Ruegeria sp.]|uniref:DUF4147 domain-containing protein n=1 Tax=uncultured Ruegeria sp. TaxID=259304 RepID=UPI00260B43CD|nr:DUF4147 domain-containing protein [uncultured Ruegeria sp.]
MALQALKSLSCAMQVGVQSPPPLETELRRTKSSLTLNHKTVVIAVGHDACTMMDTALNVFGDVSAEDAIAVTSHENHREIDGSEVLAASHPIPNAEGLDASRIVTDKLTNSGVGTNVIALISDGASALLPSPVAGVSLNDNIRINELLLASDLNIYQINLVRQCISTLKGGGILRAAYPAVVHSFSTTRQDILDPSVIGSGPSAGPLGTIADARRLLIEKGLFTRLPRLVREFLENSSTPLEVPLAPPAKVVSLAPLTRLGVA